MPAQVKPTPSSSSNTNAASSTSSSSASSSSTSPSLTSSSSTPLDRKPSLAKLISKTLTPSSSQTKLEQQPPPPSSTPSESKDGTKVDVDNDDVAERDEAARKIQRAFRAKTAKTSVGGGVERMCTCYCCGRGFSSASLPRHFPSCLPQRKVNYSSLPKELQPPTPSPPSLPVPTDSSSLEEIRAYNEAAGEIFRDHMAKCPKCPRRFEPDRLPVHMKGCKGAPTHKRERSQPVFLNSANKPGAAPAKADHRRTMSTLPSSAVAGAAKKAPSPTLGSVPSLLKKLSTSNSTPASPLISPIQTPTAKTAAKTAPTLRPSSITASIEAKDNETEKEHEAATVIQRAFRSAQAKKMGAGIQRMITCYCCGLKYSTASLPLHLPSCPDARKRNYASLPSDLRPPIPKPPNLPIPTDESTLDEIGDYNEEAGQIYRDHMAKCPKCPRRFEPDRLPPHMKGCKGPPQHKRARSVPVFHTKPPTSSSSSTAKKSTLPSTTRSSSLQLPPPGDNNLESPIQTIPRLDLLGLVKLDNEISRRSSNNKFPPPSTGGSDSNDGFSPIPVSTSSIMSAAKQSPSQRLASLIRAKLIDPKKESSQQTGPGAPSKGVPVKKPGFAALVAQLARVNRGPTINSGGLQLTLAICYCCGCPFSSGILTAHLIKCRAKRLHLNESLPRHLRPEMPIGPESDVPLGSGPELMAYNDTAAAIHRSCLPLCPACGRSYEPDRLMPHIKGCRGNAPLKSGEGMGGAGQVAPTQTLNRSTSRTSLNNSLQSYLNNSNNGIRPPPPGVAQSTDFSRPGSSGHERAPSISASSAAPAHRRSQSQSINPGSLSNYRNSKGPQGGGPDGGSELYSTSGSRMVSCYSCGQFYSIFSIGPHLATCPRKRIANYSSLPPALRPATPKPPVSIIPPPDATIQEIAAYNEEAKEIYYNHMSICPKCNRRFDGQRILPHYAACKGASGVLLSGVGGGGAGGSSVEFRWSPLLMNQKMADDPQLAIDAEQEAQAMLAAGLVHTMKGNNNRLSSSSGIGMIPPQGMTPQQMEETIGRIVGQRIGLVASSVGRALSTSEEAKQYEKEKHRSSSRKHKKSKSKKSSKKKKKSSSRKGSKKRSKSKKSSKHKSRKPSSDNSSGSDSDSQHHHHRRDRGTDPIPPPQPTLEQLANKDALPKYLAEMEAWKKVLDLETRNQQMEQQLATLRAQFNNSTSSMANATQENIKHHVNQLKDHFDKELKRRDAIKNAPPPSTAERLRAEAERQGLLTPSYPFVSPSSNAPAFYPIDVNGYDNESAARVLSAHAQFRRAGEQQSLDQLLGFAHSKPAKKSSSIHKPFVEPAAPRRPSSNPPDVGHVTYPYHHAQHPGASYTQSHVDPPPVPAALPFNVPFSQTQPLPRTSPSTPSSSTRPTSLPLSDLMEIELNRQTYPAHPRTQLGFEHPQPRNHSLSSSLPRPPQPKPKPSLPSTMSPMDDDPDRRLQERYRQAAASMNRNIPS